MKDIELEYRVELNASQKDNLKKSLRKYQSSQDKRLTVMFWGDVLEKKIDIRVRISSDGKGELVLKSGSFHSQDRIEKSCDIKASQFESLVEILSALGLKSKVTERENFRYELPREVSVAIVSAKNIHYMEIEKMTDSATKENDSRELLSILSGYGLKPIGEAEFNNLCDRLTKNVDWTYSGSVADKQNLNKELSKYIVE